MNGRLIGFAALAALAFGIAAPTASFAICPGGGPPPPPPPPRFNGPGGSVTPGLRAPSDPTPPTTPPETPPTPTPPGTVTPPSTGGNPTTPGDNPPSGPSTPSAPAQPTDPGAGGPKTPREITGEGEGKGRSARGPETLDDKTWEFWWGTNGGAYLPVIGLKAGEAPAGYAAGRDINAEAAVDAMIEGLSDQDDYVRAGAVRALATVIPPYRKDEQESLLRKLFAEDRNREVREVSALALARRGTVDLVPEFRKMMKAEAQHDVSRGFAALALVLLKDQQGIDEALAMARSNPHDADLAGAVLVTVGWTKDAQYLKTLTSAAERMGGPAVRARRVRCDAIVGLGKMGDPAAIPTLATLLKDREKAIARSAAIALGGFRDDESAYQALRRFGVTHEDPFVRAFSALSMGRIGRLEAGPVLDQMAKKDEQPAVKPFVSIAMGLLGESTLSMFLDAPLRRGPRDGNFAAAALAAGFLKATEYEEPLAAALGGDQWVEGYACTGLGLMGAKTRAEAMKKRLWASDAEIQFGAVTGLGYLDQMMAADFLSKELRAASAFHKKLPLVDALSLVGTTPDAKDIATVMKQAKSHRDMRVRSFYAMARILNGRQPSWTTDLFANTYYINNNIVLWHLTVFP